MPAYLLSKRTLVRSVAGMVGADLRHRVRGTASCHDTIDVIRRDNQRPPAQGRPAAGFRGRVSRPCHVPFLDPFGHASRLSVPAVGGWMFWLSRKEVGRVVTRACLGSSHSGPR
jgi:hypothetical protein